MFLNHSGFGAPYGVRALLRPACLRAASDDPRMGSQDFHVRCSSPLTPFGGTGMAKAGGAGRERDVGLLEATARADASTGETLAHWHARYDRWLAAQIRRRFSSQSGEDITQETWLRMAALDGIEAIRHPKAFLLRVASNLALGQVRRGAVAERFAAVTPTVSHEDADQLETVFFRQMVLDLPQPLRDVFLLSRVGGLTNSQIADQLGISPKTVEWRMTRALARCAAQVRR